MIKSHNKNVFENQYRDAIDRRSVNAIFWRYNWFEQSSISWRVQRFVNALLLIKQLTWIIMLVLRCDWRPIVTNEWSNLRQAVQQKSTWWPIARPMQLFWRYNRLENSSISSRVRRRKRTANIISLTKQLTRKQSCLHHDFMSRTLCCLLSKTYDAWKTESCQKHLQKLLFDLIERWVLWMWNVKIKNRRDFRNLTYRMRSRLFHQWE